MLIIKRHPSWLLYFLHIKPFCVCIARYKHERMLGEFKTDMQTQVRVKKEYVCTQKPSYVTFFRQKKDKSSNNPIHVINFRSPKGNFKKHNHWAWKTAVNGTVLLIKSIPHNNVNIALMPAFLFLNNMQLTILCNMQVERTIHLPVAS